MHHSFMIGDILCEGCSGAIQDIIRHADPAAQIAMDMDTGLLEIDSELSRHLLEAGYLTEDA